MLRFSSSVSYRRPGIIRIVATLKMIIYYAGQKKHKLNIDSECLFAYACVAIGFY